MLHASIGQGMCSKDPTELESSLKRSQTSLFSLMPSLLLGCRLLLALQVELLARPRALQTYQLFLYSSFYSGIIQPLFRHPLFWKLCWHNSLIPTFTCMSCPDLLIGASLSEPHTDKFRFCRVYIYIYMYAPYVRLTVYFYLQQRQRLRRSIERERERWACGC